MRSETERMFPSLKPHQIERAAAHGKARHVEEGEILLEAGARNAPVFIVKAGQIDLVQPPGTDEHIIGSLGPGQFTGEAGMLSGRPRLVRVRAAQAGELIELQREQLMALIQTDSEGSIAISFVHQVLKE
jgi:CRP-like cAMP-binding protein